MIGIFALIGGAGAHVGDVIAGVDVVVVEGELPLAVEATFGLVVDDDGDGAYAWICHEAVTAEGSIFLPDYARSTTGEWLATVRVAEEGRGGRTVFHSPAGCAWNDVAGLDGIVVSEAVYDPDDPQMAWAAGASTEGASVYASADGGRTWTVSRSPEPERGLHGVRVVDGEVYVSGTNGAGTAAFVLRRDADGAWTEAALPDLGGIEGARLRILDVSDEALYLNVDPIGSDVLFVADRGLTSFVRAFEDQGEILDAAVVEDGVWLPMDFGQRALRLTPDGGSFEEVEFPPSTGAGVAQNGTLLVAAQSYVDGPLLEVRGPGGFVPEAYPDDVVAPLECPAGTEMVDVCAPLWSGLEGRLRGFDAPPVDSGFATRTLPDDEGCGCAAGPWGFGAMAWPALWLSFRRGRGSRRPRRP